MTARVFSGERLPAVEQFDTGRRRGCIVRWDFETVRLPVRPDDRRSDFRSRKAGEHTPGAETSVPAPEEMRDSVIVAFSEMRYTGKPDPERVVADIEKDMALRYGDTPRPETDYQYYRGAIAALPDA